MTKYTLKVVGQDAHYVISADKFIVQDGMIMFYKKSGILDDLVSAFPSQITIIASVHKIPEPDSKFIQDLRNIINK